MDDEHKPVEVVIKPGGLHEPGGDCHRITCTCGYHSHGYTLLECISGFSSHCIFSSTR